MNVESLVSGVYIINLKVDGKNQKVVLKDLQRHPFKQRIQHMDFQRVSATQTITMQVPLHFLGEDECPGVKAGGKISKTITEVEIRCLAKNLPEFLEVDLSTSELDAVIHLSDIQLPKGVEITAISHGNENNQPVASVHIPKRSAADDASSSASASSSSSSSEDESSK